LHVLLPQSSAVRGTYPPKTPEGLLAVAGSGFRPSNSPGLPGMARSPENGAAIQSILLDGIRASQEGRSVVPLPGAHMSLLLGLVIFFLIEEMNFFLLIFDCNK